MDDVRSAMEDAGFDDYVVQTFGSSRDIMIRMPTGEEGDSGADISTRVLEALSEKAEGIEMRRVEFVGPQIGRELTEDRKSTRLNSSHVANSYAVVCLTTQN